MPKRKNGLKITALVLLITGIILLILSSLGILLANPESTNKIIVLIVAWSPEVGGIGIGLLVASGTTGLISLFRKR